MLTGYEKEKLANGLQRRLLLGEYYGRPLEFLRHWESVNGQQYLGMGADEVYAYGVQYGYDAMVGKFGLNEMMGGMTAPGGPNTLLNRPVPTDRPDENIGAIIDGMHLNPSTAKMFFEGTGYESMADNIDWKNSSTGDAMMDGVLSNNIKVTEKMAAKKEALKNAGYDVTDNGGSDISYGGVFVDKKDGKVVAMTTEWGVIHFKGLRPGLPNGWWKLAKGTVVGQNSGAGGSWEDGLENTSKALFWAASALTGGQSIIDYAAAVDPRLGTGTINMVKENKYGAKLMNISKALDKVSYAGAVTAGTIELVKFSQSDGSLGDWGKLGVNSLSIGLSLSKGVGSFVGVGIGIWDISGNADWFYYGLDVRGADFDFNSKSVQNSPFRPFK